MTITASVVSQPITAAVSGGGAITANVGASTVSAAASGGIGPQGPAGSAGATGAAGDPAVTAYASVANFPATGSANALYLSTATSRLYRWVAASSVYAEVGSGGSV